MDITVTQKYVRISPKKLRLIADVVRKLTPADTLDKLLFLRKSGSEVFVKVIKNSLSIARQKGLSDTDLVFKEIQIGEGPRLKRGRAASRGRWHPYKKRMSHIRVVLTTSKSDQSVQTGISNPKSETEKAKNAEMSKTDKKENDNKTVGKEEDISGAKEITKNLKSKLKSVISKKGAKK